MQFVRYVYINILKLTKQYFYINLTFENLISDNALVKILFPVGFTNLISFLLDYTESK